MEAPAQPAVTTPVATPVQPLSNYPTPSTSTSKKSNMPLILSVLLFFVVAVILIVLIVVSRGAPPVTDVVSTDNVPTANRPATATIEGATVYEGKMFNVTFESVSEITTDKTTKQTYPDGTTWCMFEEMSGEDVSINLIQGKQCETSDDMTTDGEELVVNSKDSKQVAFLLYPDGETFKAQGRFNGKNSQDLPTIVKLSFSGSTMADLKAKINELVGTLTFDTTAVLKTEIADTIVTSDSSDIEQGM